MRRYVDHDSGVPLYVQVKNRLIEELESGVLQPGSFFPSLSEMSKTYGVSIITSRRVVSDLVSEGYLETSRGARPRVRRKSSDSITAAPLLKKKHIGIVFPSLKGELCINAQEAPWTNAIFTGIQESMGGEYYLTLLPVSNCKKAFHQEIIDNVAGFDGFIFFPLSMDEDMRALLARIDRPYVMIDRWEEDIAFNYVASDNYNGGRQVADYLVDMGITSYLVLMIKTFDYTEFLKIRGFQEAVLRRGIGISNLDIRDVDDIYMESGYRALERYYKEKRCLPGAIFTAGDYLAIGAIKFCQDNGIEIPEQVSVVSSTGIELGELFRPALSTLKVPMLEMGRAAAEMLFRMMKTGTRQLPGIELPVQLEIRDSTELIGDAKIDRTAN
ncbi:MAG: GntR family transcriptional regulator [bacterium]|nr:GntR family transcriptional regulator [bacterium]